MPIALAEQLLFVQVAGMLHFSWATHQYRTAPPFHYSADRRILFHIQTLLWMLFIAIYFLVGALPACGGLVAGFDGALYATLAYDAFEGGCLA